MHFIKDGVRWVNIEADSEGQLLLKGYKIEDEK